MKLDFLNDLHQAKAQMPWPAFQTTCHTLPISNNGTSFDATESAPFFSCTNATLTSCNSSPATPTVFRNSFDTLSLALDDEEDNPSHHHKPLQPLCICQLYLNTAKTSIRSATCFIPGPSQMQHLPRNHPPPLE